MGSAVRLFRRFAGRAVPGGVAGDRKLRANLPAIVIVQAVRVLLLSILLPVGLSAFGYAIAGFRCPWRRPGGNPWGEIAILLACCAVVAFAAYRFKFPGGIIFGAMAASAVLHGGGFIEARLPSGLTIAAMIGIGSVTGSRFRGTTRAAAALSQGRRSAPSPSASASWWSVWSGAQPAAAVAGP